MKQEVEVRGYYGQMWCVVKEYSLMNIFSRQFIIIFCLASFFLSGCSLKWTNRNLSNWEVHEVRPGETLWSIARLYGVDVHTLKEMNHIRKVDILEIGQKIYYPKPHSQTSFSHSLQSLPPVDIEGEVSFLKKGIFFPGADKRVYAIQNGRVVLVHDFPAWGKTIVVDMGDGGIVQYSGLAHALVLPGMLIVKGQDLGVSGYIPLLNKEGLLLRLYRGGQITKAETFYKERLLWVS